MSRKTQPPPKKPSKAYLISFGDTMTAMLAFFIVLNTLARDQTGANLYAGTGSFVKALKRTGFAGRYSGNRTSQQFARSAPLPIYAVPTTPPNTDSPKQGPDDQDNARTVLNRAADDFQRFLIEMERQFPVVEANATQSQVVFDSFEVLGNSADSALGQHALHLAADAIGQLVNPQFELEIIVWAQTPSETALVRAQQTARYIEQQIDRAFTFRNDQRARLTVSSQPWLFVDAKRPRVSFVLSKKHP